MSADRAGLLAHLGSAATTVCRCWAVVRRDGESYGFTDHDLDLSFDGMVFRAASGMTARAFQQTTGLAVDNSEAVGALSDVALSEADLAAGRFDGAEVRCWQVNWADPVQRMMLFRGHFGEVTRAAGSFRVELRGLADALGVDDRQVRRWAMGDYAIPEQVAAWLDRLATYHARHPPPGRSITPPSAAS